MERTSSAKRLSSEAARRVTTALYRLGLGNFSNAKGVGSGVFEFRIDFGAGYRIYFGRWRADRDSVVRRHEGAAAARYCPGEGILARLQAAEKE